ncbi:MAG TPA: hypothetical protein VKU19_19495 [Bryobacteraceae bacterium]|nr:hypothetical protein [Bryobacteraceae bacterium]
MNETEYRGRRAFTFQNAHVRVTVLKEGGHIAEILDRQTGVNPLWTPPWPSIEPSRYDGARFPEYGSGAEARLLAGIMGHNLCLDLFGGPSPEEEAAGISVHGEGSVAEYEVSESGSLLTLRTSLPLAGLAFERRLALNGHALEISETVENLSSCDRPIAWTQHVTLGPPFLEKGSTQFRASATRSKVHESDFGSASYLQAGAEFDWPYAPARGHGSVDLRLFNGAQVSSAFTTHLMDRQREDAFFAAFCPKHRLVFGYIWKTADFPWLGIWEENLSRPQAPWNGATIARGMEFGVSPFPESRREMIERGRLFDVPGYRWLPAKSRLEVKYWAVIEHADSVPETLHWPA